MPDRTPCAESVTAVGLSARRSFTAGRDTVSTERAALLRSELIRQPEIRPEVVARGRLLLADSSYPSRAVVSQLAERILAAPDLSIDES